MKFDPESIANRIKKAYQSLLSLAGPSEKIVPEYRDGMTETERRKAIYEAVKKCK